MKHSLTSRGARWVVALASVLAACGDSGTTGNNGNNGGGGDGGTGPSSGNCMSGSMVPGRWTRSMTGTDADFVGAFGTAPNKFMAIADTVVRRYEPEVPHFVDALTGASTGRPDALAPPRFQELLVQRARAIGYAASP